MTFYGPPQSWYEPPDPEIFQCKFSGESCEDCGEDEHPEQGECEPDEAPEPDWESIAEARAEMAAERDAWDDY